jgi:hypothetical protein
VLSCVDLHGEQGVPAAASETFCDRAFGSCQSDV